jgi:hypothetical protein
MNASVLQQQAPIHPLKPDNFEDDWKRFQPGELSAHLPAIVLDAEGSIQHLTPAARSLLEYRKDQHVEPCFFSHVHGRNLYQVMRDVADMVCYGKSRANWLLRLRTGSGRWNWFKAAVKNQLDDLDGVITISLRDLRDG